jgi:sucrose-6-phosphate hydrolase SacC (GH32 family)
MGEADAIRRAMTALSAATARASADPIRPRFHFAAPAGWINDPNGTIWHNGWYHVFYQHNPFGDVWDTMHWGHARSRDLLRWEHLPIALAPQNALGETHCFSGCAALAPDGTPTLLYTSVHIDDAGNSVSHQWRATGDADWRVWRSAEDNPFLQPPAGMALKPDWRDPFVFAHGGQTWLVIGAASADDAHVLLYQSRGGALNAWDYRGVLFSQPVATTGFQECPNVIPFGDKFLLLTSPYRPVEWRVGEINWKTFALNPVRSGVLDGGPGDTGASAHFYAPNVLRDPAGRVILFGWVRGFPEGRGWNGCLALPRVLTLGPDNRPRQQPLPELEALRGPAIEVRSAPLSSLLPLTNVRGVSLELDVTIDMGNALSAGVFVRASRSGMRGIRITLDGSSLRVGDARIDASRFARLRIFIDRSVLEVFLDDGRGVITRVIADAPIEDDSVFLFAENGKARLERMTAWTLNTP